MRIKDYLNQLLSSITKNPYIESQNLSFEEHPPNAAYITGTIVFINSSKLHFKEFIIFKSKSIDFLKYAYNYSDKDATTIFRYDNALDPRARKLSTYPEHKHISKKILPVRRPATEDVLKEISDFIEQGMKR